MRYIKEYFERYERHAGFAFLIGGFIFDNLTLRRIDLLVDNLILLADLCIAALAIVIINVPIDLRYTFARKLQDIAPYALQFVFGGLFSGFIVFYSRSSVWITSWPFLIMLVGFLIGNEFLRRRYQQFIFQLIIFFITVFSYFIFSVPLVLHRMGPDVFLISGALSLFVVGTLYFLIVRIGYATLRDHQRIVIKSILSIFLLFCFLYFTNIIPPIPLSLKDIGIYHFVEKTTEGTYQGIIEEAHWYQFWRTPVYHFVEGESAYAYSAVFAPTKISALITHEWSFFNEASNEWITTNRIAFPIYGGRDGGYRGYSIKQNIIAGKWRINVLTERDQLIGRITFYAEKGNQRPPQAIKRL